MALFGGTRKFRASSKKALFETRLEFDSFDVMSRIGSSRFQEACRDLQRDSYDVCDSGNEICINHYYPRRRRIGIYWPRRRQFSSTFGVINAARAVIARVK
jgi:hypothetical protein